MRKKTAEIGIIRQMAIDARERMIQRSYGNRFENEALRRSIENANNIKLYSMKKPEISIKIIENTQDVEFKQKVYSMLSQNCDITNPLVKLIDKNVFDKLTEIEKERMILEISEKYINLKNQYYGTY